MCAREEKVGWYENYVFMIREIEVLLGGLRKQ